MKPQYLAAWRLAAALSAARCRQPQRLVIAGSRFTGGHFMQIDRETRNA